MKRITALLFLMVSLAINGIAQDLEQLKNRGNLSIGIHLGVSQSGTDTNSWGRHGASLINHAHLLYGLNINYQISSRLSVRANWFSSKMSGNDLDIDGPCSDLNDNDVPGNCHKNRGWSFESPLNELGVDLEWHIFKRRNALKEADQYEFGDNKRSLFRKAISPYITLGVAYAFTNPDVTFSEGAPPSNATQQEDIQDLSSPYIQFPIGIGVKLDLTRSFSMDLEARGVFPQSDLLDGMSAVTNYDDERNNGDAYQFLSVRLNYHL